jgi:branched-subunit amino acid transport protein AzlD
VETFEIYKYYECFKADENVMFIMHVVCPSIMSMLIYSLHAGYFMLPGHVGFVRLAGTCIVIILRTKTKRLPAILA